MANLRMNPLSGSHGIIGDAPGIEAGSEFGDPPHVVVVPDVTEAPLGDPIPILPPTPTREPFENIPVAPYGPLFKFTLDELPLMLHPSG